MGRLLRVALRGLFALGIGLVLLEGAASLLHFAASVNAGATPLAERLHTQYDPELGWVSTPNVRLPDLYGPGVSLSTNARGFRGTREYADEVPAGVRRVICSGDSFTLGYGVGDDETWCALLAREAPGVETVNMGQGGYGIDQAYLWYRRDGHSLAHQLHVLAFIHEDFLRMESDRFFGYGKPVLTLRGGALVPENLPVPRHAREASWLKENEPFLSELRSFTLLQALAQRILPTPPRPPPGADLLPLSLRIFEELHALDRARGSALVLVYLPMREDRTPGPQDAWRREIQRAAAERGIPFVDLVEPFRELSARDFDRSFLHPGEIALPAAEGHYTVAGNARVARLLARALSGAGLLPAGSASN